MWVDVRGVCYFRDEDGLLPHKEIKEDKYDKIF